MHDRAQKSGSRSPRRCTNNRNAGEMSTNTDMQQCNAIDGADLVEMDEPMGQLRFQRSYLEHFLQPSPPPIAARGPVLREMAAGLPIEAARTFIFTGPELVGVPWKGLPPQLACFAATLRLFSRLLPGCIHEAACERFCSGHCLQNCSPQSPSESLHELASEWGLISSSVMSATESLKAMIKNQLVVCCICLEDYIGVVTDPETGVEAEQDVGTHCVMVVGGDLFGPNYVTFDPWGLNGGELVYWSAHNAQAASPTAWIELAPLVQKRTRTIP